MHDACYLCIAKLIVLVNFTVITCHEITSFAFLNLDEDLPLRPIPKFFDTTLPIVTLSTLSSSKNSQISIESCSRYHVLYLCALFERSVNATTLQTGFNVSTSIRGGFLNYFTLKQRADSTKHPPGLLSRIS
jgi:hypothetical protein